MKRICGEKGLTELLEELETSLVPESPASPEASEITRITTITTVKKDSEGKRTVTTTSDTTKVNNNRNTNNSEELEETKIQMLPRESNAAKDKFRKKAEISRASNKQEPNRKEKSQVVDHPAQPDEVSGAKVSSSEAVGTNRAVIELQDELNALRRSTKLLETQLLGDKVSRLQSETGILTKRVESMELEKSKKESYEEPPLMAPTSHKLVPQPQTSAAASSIEMIPRIDQSPQSEEESMYVVGVDTRNELLEGAWSVESTEVTPES